LVDTFIRDGIDALSPWVGNTRTHTQKQIRQIAESIRTFGFTNPVLNNEGRCIPAENAVWAHEILAIEFDAPVTAGETA